MFTKADCSKNLQITTWLSNITFHSQPIWLQALVVIHSRLQTLVVIDSESRLTSFSSFCAPPSEVAVLLDSNLSRCPFLGQVVNLDLLFCTGFHSEHVVLFLCHIFTQRQMTDRKIERRDGRCFGRQQDPANSTKFSFHMKEKSDL